MNIYAYDRCIHNTWEVGYPPVPQQLHITQHDHAIRQYGQEGLNTTVLPNHTNMKIINYY